MMYTKANMEKCGVDAINSVENEEIKFNDLIVGMH